MIADGVHLDKRGGADLFGNTHFGLYRLAQTGQSAILEPLQTDWSVKCFSEINAGGIDDGNHMDQAA